MSADRVVYVVDDDDAVRNAVSHFFRTADLEVETFESAAAEETAGAGFAAGVAAVAGLAVVPGTALAFAAGAALGFAAAGRV